MNWIGNLQSNDPSHSTRLRAGPKILRRDLFDCLASQRFHPEIKRARVPCAHGLIRNPLHELREERVLHMNWQGQHAIEEPLNRWQFFE